MPPSPDGPEPRRSPLITWVGLALIFGGLFVYFLIDPGGLDGTEGQQHPSVGRVLPALQVEPLTGDIIPTSLDLLQGKVVLVNFWGPWCHYCLVEFPHLVQLERSLRDRDDFRLLAISCGMDLSREDLDVLQQRTEDYLRRSGADLPTYADPGAVSRQAMMMVTGMEEFGYPTTVLLDRQGVIRGMWLGYRAGYEREMSRMIDQLLDAET